MVHKMPLPLDPLKREQYLISLRERAANRASINNIKRKELEVSKVAFWIANAPLCKCGCNTKVNVNVSFGLKERYKNYPYHDYLPGHNCRLINQDLKLTSDEEQLILGSLMGDASLDFAHKRASAPRLSMNHGSKQHAYVSFKAQELARLGATVRILKNGGYGAFNARLSTPTLECLKPIHELMYTPKKVITKTLLDKLTYRAWAFWWMDDGSLSKTSISGTLSTCSFSEEDHKLLKSYFYDYGIETVVDFRKYFYLRFNKQGIVKFINKINSEVPLGIMDYKFELVDHG